MGLFNKKGCVQLNPSLIGLSSYFLDASMPPLLELASLSLDRMTSLRVNLNKKNIKKKKMFDSKIVDMLNGNFERK